MTSAKPPIDPTAADQPDQLQAIFDAMPDGVVTVDRDWRFAFANKRALEIVNTPQIVGHDIFQLFPGNLEEPFQSTYRTAMEKRIASGFEAFHSDPLNLWLKVEARPYDGGIIVFFSDITARKLSELREQATAQRLAEVLEATSDAVASLDRNWRYTFLNQNAFRLIDPTHTLLGRNIWEAFPDAVGGPAWEAYHKSMKQGIPAHAELYYGNPVNAWLSLESRPAPEGIVVFFRDITEQKNHEAVVRAQQEMLCVVQRAARSATWDLDPATGAIHYGPGSFNVLGQPTGQLNSLQDLEGLLLPGHLDRLRAQMVKAIQHREMVVTELAVHAADGAVVWVECRGQAVTLPDGTTRIRGMSLDITQRKLDQTDLIASEERYRVLADLNPQAIWMGDAAGNITYANQGFLNYLGLQLDTLGGMGWLAGFEPSDQERIARVWTQSVTTGQDYDTEAMLRHAATGQYRYWHLKAAPVRDSAGNILHWLGVAHDIHEAKTYAATLRAEQIETERRSAELEILYATTPVGLALLDPIEFRFLNLNQHEAEMLGYPREALIGRPLAEIASPEGMPGLLEIFRKVASGQTIRDLLVEGELASRPGERRSFSVNYSPVFKEDGSVRAISTASIEITNQKKAEAALIQSEKLAAVGRLASSISHEINNPLEAITNLLYLIALDPQLPDALKVYVHMAQSELARVSQIATQTLRFHRQAVNATSVTAEDLVGAVIRLYIGRLTNSRVKVDARYNTDTRILCFENDIRQVLNNLIANAIDAMRSGGRLIVRAHAVHDPSGQAGVRITIADTGHGMSPETLARIFEPFYTTKDLQGTGLGLWISSGIVDRHQGRLTVRSSQHPVHHGTIFTLFLPRETTAPQRA